MSFYSQQSTEQGERVEHISEADLDDDRGGAHHDGQHQEAEPRTKLIVNYLPQSLTDEQLCSLFSKVGPVVSAKIIRDSSTNYSYGYGFVEMSCPEDAEEAIEQLKGHQIQNKRLGVALARSYDKESLKNTNLYITSIPSSHSSEDALRQLFGQYGKIINVKVLSDERTHQSRGTAFIRFDRREEAEEAIKSLNGYQIPGSFESLVVKVSEDHGKQKANHFLGYVNAQQQYYRGGGGGDGGYHHGGYRGGHRGGGHRGGRWNGGGGGGHYDQRRGGGGRGGYYGGGGSRGGGGGNDYYYGGGGGNQWN